MTQPFEFKNPLDGAPRPLTDAAGKNPFADEQQPVAEVDDDNVYATSNSRLSGEKPQYVTMLTHSGPLLLRLGIVNLLVGLVVAGLLFLVGELIVVLLASGVLAFALAIKAARDLQAIGAGAMHADGRTATRAALVLSVVNIGSAVVCLVLWLWLT